MFAMKEAPKKMINGWRAKAAIYEQLTEVMQKTEEEYGNGFTKALFMDEVIRLGLRELCEENKA